MPELDGYSFSRAMRNIEADKKLAPTPVIAWTANARTEEFQFCQNAGMDDLLVKPADLAQLKKILLKWLPNKYIASEQNLSVTPAIDAAHVNSPINYLELNKVVPDPTEHLDILQEYQTHMRADLTKLRHELDKSNYSSLEQTAHRMKGSSKMVGATDIALACFNVEQAAKKENLSNVTTEIEQLVKAIVQLEIYLANVNLI
jgi:HPt (histidine-containing phosphotransfer) domain-containing protein